MQVERFKTDRSIKVCNNTTPERPINEFSSQKAVSFSKSDLLVFNRLTLNSYTRMSSNCSDEYFQATNHAEQTFRKMETYLQHKQLCDVLLIAGNHKIPAHR